MLRYYSTNYRALQKTTESVSCNLSNISELWQNYTYYRENGVHTYIYVPYYTYYICLYMYLSVVSVVSVLYICKSASYSATLSDF